MMTHTNGTLTPVLNNTAALTDPYELRERETQAFLRAIDTMHGVSLDELVTPGQIRALHRAIFDGLYPHAGEFRNEPIRVAWHIPAATTRGEIEQQIAQYTDDVRRRLALALLRPEAVPALIGFAFWKLTYIAPFADGNGRTANALAILLQRAFGLPGASLYDRMQQSEYAQFVQALRAYDAGNATPFFDYLHTKTGLGV